MLSNLGELVKHKILLSQLSLLKYHIFTFKIKKHNNMYLFINQTSRFKNKQL